MLQNRQKEIDFIPFLFLNKEIKMFILLPHRAIIQPLPPPKTSCTNNV